jgi:hypothetical protein
LSKEMTLPSDSAFACAWGASSHFTLVDATSGNNFSGWKDLLSLPGFGHVANKLPLEENNPPRKSTPSLSDPDDVSSLASGTAVFSSLPSPSLTGDPFTQIEHDQLYLSFEKLQRKGGLITGRDNDLHLDDLMVNGDLSSDDDDREPPFWGPERVDDNDGSNQLLEEGERKGGSQGSANRPKRRNDNDNDEGDNDNGEGDNGNEGDNDNYGGDNGDDDGGDYVERQPVSSRKRRTKHGPLLACPFYVRDPRRSKECRQSKSSTIGLLK